MHWRFVLIIIATFIIFCIYTVSADTSIEILNDIGIVSGDEHGNLNADRLITRAEFTAMIVKAFGIEMEQPFKNSFYDMEGHWGATYVSAAKEKGIIDGINSTHFEPDLTITFNQAVKILITAVGYRPEGNFPYGYIIVANAKGITKGIETAERDLTRGEAATLLLNSINLYSVTYNDENNETLSFDKIIRKSGYTVVNGKAKKVAKKEFPIWDALEMPYQNPDFKQEPFITAYLVEGEKRPAVVFYPGGAYQRISAIESAQISEFFNRCGISVFVVNYRVAPYTYNAIVSDAFRAIRLVKNKADELGIDAEKVGVAGCSAGGHLASYVSTQFSSAEKLIGDSIDDISPKPAFSVLGYPVITMKNEYTHANSKKNFFGMDNTSDEMTEKFSNENNVTSETPSTFIFHALFDGSVNVMNSINYAMALQKNDVPCELHIYPEAGHGFANGFSKERACDWNDACERWLAFIGIIQ